jgi:hypothetical protein
MLGEVGNDAAGGEASAVNEKLLSDERVSTQVAGQDLIPGEQAAENASSSSGLSNLAALATGTLRSSLQESSAGQERSAPQQGVATLPVVSRATQASDPLPGAASDPAAFKLNTRTAESAAPQQSSPQRSEPNDKKLANLDDLSQTSLTALAMTPVPSAPPAAAEVAARAGTIASTASGSAIPSFPPQHDASALMGQGKSITPSLQPSPIGSPNREHAEASEGAGVGGSIAAGRSAVAGSISAPPEPVPMQESERHPGSSFGPAQLSAQPENQPATSSNLKINPVPGDSADDSDLAPPISAPVEPDPEQAGAAQAIESRTGSRALRGSWADEPAAAAPQATATGATAHANQVQIRDQASISTNGPAANSIGSTAPSAPRDPFSALDSPAGAAPAWVHAGAQRAEAGFDDPALGWVGVRAGLGEGGVHAAVVPASPDAAASLGTHLAGLSAYLAQHHTEVSTVALATPESRALGSGLGPGAQHAPGHGTGDGAPAGEDHSADQDSTSAARTDGFSMAAVPTEAASQHVEPVSGSIAPAASMAGTRISVMA